MCVRVCVCACVRVSVRMRMRVLVRVCPQTFRHFGRRMMNRPSSNPRTFLSSQFMMNGNFYVCRSHMRDGAIHYKLYLLKLTMNVDNFVFRIIKGAC